jgi:hypothetical protein
MTRREVVWRQVVDELANALQVAIGRAGQVRRTAQTTAEETALLEEAIARAVSALRRLEPRKRGK